MTERVELSEVAPRDGLQSIGPFVPTETKIALVRASYEAGLRRMEVGSFVSPRAVPCVARHSQHRVHAPDDHAELERLPVPLGSGARRQLDLRRSELRDRAAAEVRIEPPGKVAEARGRAPSVREQTTGRGTEELSERVRRTVRAVDLSSDMDVVIVGEQ